MICDSRRSCLSVQHHLRINDTPGTSTRCWGLVHFVHIFPFLVSLGFLLEDSFGGCVWAINVEAHAAHCRMANVVIRVTVLFLGMLFVINVEMVLLHVTHCRMANMIILINRFNWYFARSWSEPYMSTKRRSCPGGVQDCFRPRWGHLVHQVHCRR